MAKSSSVAVAHRHDRAGGRVADQLDALERRRRPRAGTAAATACVHEQALGGVAHARPLDLGVDDDVERHVEIGGGVDVDVAVAVAVDHVRDGGVLEDRRDQRRAAPRDQAVDDAAQPHELHGRLARRVLDEHHGVGGQAGLGARPRGARAAMARLDAMAPDEPRRNAALPLLTHSAAASLVTFGRFS